ncbi:MFS transporter [Actinopolymorpha alba]|uniref:MFS transporter n=1 Tax=Actinopolymorpha alba TaxID=533267 RepID=UPI000360E631|nr:MFS transporter [Actinopolymorpha alba]
MPLLLANRLIPAPYRRLLAHRGLRALVPAFAVSDLGDGMSMVAVPLLAIAIAPSGGSGSGSGVLVGAAVAASTLPGVVGMLVFRRWLRALAGRRLVVTDSLVRALALGCVPVAWFAGVLSPVAYVGILAASSLLHAWGAAGKYALVAEIVPAEQRLAANALVSSISSGAIVVGPALAGLLATRLSPAWIIGIDALSFAALAVLTSRIRTRPAPADPVPVNAGGEAVTVRGLLRRQPQLLGLLVLTWFFNFLYGPVEVALPLHITADLRAEADLLGAYWTLFGAGAVVGGLAAGALRRLPLWPATLGIVACWGVLLLPFALPLPVPVTLTCFALGGLVYGPFPALSFTLFQSRTPPAHLSSVLAARSAALLTASPVGAALGGPLTTAFGPRAVLTGSGAATVILALAGVLTGALILSRTSRTRRRLAGGS